MICAHYDDKSSGSFAPDADDNGTASSLVINNDIDSSDINISSSVI